MIVRPAGGAPIAEGDVKGHRICVLSDMEVLQWLGGNRRRIRQDHKQQG